MKIFLILIAFFAVNSINAQEENSKAFAGIKEWSLGERYGTSLVNDFNSGTVA